MNISVRRRNPATEESAATISLGSAADVDRAVKAARAAFPAYSRSSKAERIALLQRVIEAYKARYDNIAKAISMEMGAPSWLATKAGVREGATLVTGGPGRPEGLERGYYVRPTVFANVTPAMTIAREEIFGPVLSIMPYETEAQVIELANDTVYGLAGYVQSGDLAHARRVASELRAGQINLNGAAGDMAAPFGGYKQSGNGREWGKYGFEEFLEIKAVLGYQPA